MVRAWTRDLALGFRGLRRRPGFTGVVVLTLALGIGGTTALFSVFRTVFLEPLPLPDSHELVVIMEAGGFGCCGPASGPDYVDWEERQRSFDGIAALNPGTMTLSGLDEPERLHGVQVTASAFQLLDVEPLAGRYLLPEDEVAQGAVVLSHQMWQRIMGGDPDVLGTTLEVDGTAYTVVGIMPPAFDVPSPWSRTLSHQLFLPLPPEMLDVDRANHSLPVIGRLADGVTKASAQADMDRVMSELATEYPASNAEREARVFTVHEYLYKDVGRQLGLILGAAALVLLIACANVAGLQLARAASREAELAVRTALGASRAQMARLLFAESVTLAMLGGLVGIGVTAAAIRGLRVMLPATIPRVEAVSMDGMTLVFAVGAAGVTALAFGVLPAILASRTGLAASVKEGGYSTLAPGKERVRDAFIVGQIALGLVLANGAGLLVRSYAELRGQEYGFDAESALTMALQVSGPRYEEPAARQAYFDRVNEAVATVPGVRTVGFVSRLPLAGGTNGHVQIADRPPRSNADDGPLVEVASVNGDYFGAMGIPLRRGRTLEAVDTVSGAVGVVINQRMADEAWPGEDPIGKQFGFGTPPPWLTVVGVVGNARQWSAERPPIAQTYFPYVSGWNSNGFLVARVDGDPAAVASAVRRAVLAVDPSQPPTNIQVMSDRVDRAFAQRRFYTTLIALFAGAALFLAAAGVYGTVSYYVARRVREIGIRMALGAGGSGILALIVRRGVRLAVFGLAVGLVGVWATTSVVEGMVYGVGAVNVPTLVMGCLVLAGTAVLASALPGARAVRISAVLALRSE